MAAKIGHLKPFMIEEKKEGPNQVVSETTANKWQGIILANIKKNETWIPLLNKDWKVKKVANRGFTGAQAAETAVQVDQMLEYLSQYAPNCLYRDITLRATSLSAVWILVRNWAGLKSSGCKQQVYYNVKHSFVTDGDTTPTDFYFTLRNAKEDCLLLSAASGGKVSFHGAIPAEDEDLSPTLESDVVLDWLDALGGSKLVHQVFRVFSKELESESLADIRQTISDNLTNLLAEADQQAEVNRAQVQFAPRGRFNQRGKTRTIQNLNPPSWRPPALPRQPPYTTPRYQIPQRAQPCKLCLLSNPQAAHSHTIGSCHQLSGAERTQVSRSVLADNVMDKDSTRVNDDHLYPTYDYPLYDDGDANDDEEPVEETQVNAHMVLASNDQPVVRISRVNIHESPILAVTYLGKTVYLVLDTGATASLITLKKVKSLNLQIYRTSHKAIQVDGESPLPVLGEVHTTFYRGGLKLTFSGLVVATLGVDILAGMNFHIENDVYSRMAKNTISVGDKSIFQSSPPSLLALDYMSSPNKSFHRFVKVPAATTILPGEEITLTAPPDIPHDSYVMVEPNLGQAKPFFKPKIVQLNNSSFSVSSNVREPVQLKKNCQALCMYTTCSDVPDTKPLHLDPEPIALKSTAEILRDINIDGNLSQKEKGPLLKAVSENSEVFQASLPGYNHAFGQVYASFKFASKSRPSAQKLRSPNYGSHQDLLFNKKCMQLKQQGVLVDPAEMDIQPVLTHNSWVVKKPSSANIPWEKCEVKDVRLVVGLDPLNKYLQDPPGKITKTATIYSSLAGWEFMGEIDFSDFYFQIKFRSDSERDREKLGYLCIRSAVGTFCFSRATMGLLGMDVYQDELTDKLLGDLVLSGHVVKIADNVYFGAQSLEEFQKVFVTILSRCKEADLRLKPSKVKLNVQSADILGLHWSKGKLSPSKHKLDPLATVDPPKTVSGLRSWLGAVRFNEVCLPGAKLAQFTKLLDEEIPAVRSGKEDVVWNAELLHNFKQVQAILRQPISVTIPRKGDQVYLATDACTTLPAGGTKMFLKRPGVSHFLPSFNFGSRIPKTLRTWSPCEVEAFFLNKGIDKSEFYTKQTGNPGIALTDNKPVFQAKQNMDKGIFSSSKKLQDLLANLSAKRFTVQLLSAKIPSPILHVVDFASRNPASCDTIKCTICKDTSEPVVRAALSTTTDPNLHLMSTSAWKEIQQSCPVLRRAHALLISGAKVSKKENNVKDLNCYLRNCTVNKLGLVVALKSVPYQAKPNELLVIPRSYSFTFGKALHHNLNHPSHSQMIQQFDRKYFMLDSKNVLKMVFDTCEYPCQASHILPKESVEYSTETKPSRLGEHFGADVLQESGQKILVVREILTSFTDSIIVKNQTKQCLKDALVILLSRLKLGPRAQIRVDGQSALSSLKVDKSLEPLGIHLVVGRPKNPNKNATVDKAIRELREQLVKISPHGGPVSDAQLARATGHLNDIIRHPGRSARELWVSRDESSGSNIQLDDKDLSDKQFSLRVSTHESSSKYRSRNGPKPKAVSFELGDLVYVKTDRSKSKARDSFTIVSLDENKSLATLQKFPMLKFRHKPIEVSFQNIYHTSAVPVSPNQVNLNKLSPESAVKLEPPVHKPTKSSSYLSKTPIYTPLSDSDSDSDDDNANNPVLPFPTPPHDVEIDDNIIIHDEDLHVDHQWHPVDMESSHDVEIDGNLIIEDGDLHNDVNYCHVETEDQGNETSDQENEVNSSGSSSLYDSLDESPISLSETCVILDVHLPQPQHADPDRLSQGDVIAVVHEGVWKKARLLSHSGLADLQSNSLYWNYEDLDGTNARGSYLVKGKSWGVLRGTDRELDLSKVNIILE